MRLKLSTKCQEQTSLELSTPSSREATGVKGVAHTCPRNRMLLVAETYHEAIASGDQWVKSSFDSLCAHQKITKHQQLAGQLRSATRLALVPCQQNANNSHRKVQTRFSISMKGNPRRFGARAGPGSVGFLGGRASGMQ